MLRIKVEVANKDRHDVWLENIARAMRPVFEARNASFHWREDKESGILESNVFEVSVYTPMEERVGLYDSIRHRVKMANEPVHTISITHDVGFAKYRVKK